MQRSFLLSQIYAFSTVTFWSSAYVFTKTALNYYSFSSLALLRCAIASLFLGVVLVVYKKPLPDRRSWFWFLLSGAAGFALYILVFNKGSASLNPTTSCILISTSPIITACLAQICFREKLGARRWIAIVMAFCGILVMTLWGGALSVSEGIAWMLAAALLISVYNILQRLLSRKFEPLCITAYSFFAGMLLLVPFLPEAAMQIADAPAMQIWLVVFLGICPSAVAYLFWARALSLAPSTSNVSNYMFLTPFLALLLEYAVTGELPGAATFAGGGIIMASLAVFVLAGRKK